MSMASKGKSGETERSHAYLEPHGTKEVWVGSCTLLAMESRVCICEANAGPLTKTPSSGMDRNLLWEVLTFYIYLKTLLVYLKLANYKLHLRAVFVLKKEKISEEGRLREIVKSKIYYN